MQKISLLLFLTIQTFQANAQIDALITEEEVKAFIKTLDRRYDNFRLKKVTELTERDNYNQTLDKNLCQKTAEQLGLKEAFYKDDFDDNGLTDILLLGIYDGIDALIVLAQDYGEYSYHRLGNMNQEGCIYPVFMYHGNQPILELTYQKRLTYRERNLKKYQPEEFYASHNDDLITQSYVFRDGQLTEYNANPIKYDIEKIEFSTNGCYGACPVFKLTINNSRQALFNARKYNHKFNPETKKNVEIKGLYRARLKTETYQKLIDQINYFDFPNLKDGYSTDATDMASSSLTITYNKGQIKTIQDYGMQGTRGLRNLYISLANLRTTVDWQSQPEY